MTIRGTTPEWFWHQLLCDSSFVCWYLILSDGVYFDDFDVETGHGINVTEEDLNPGALPYHTSTRARRSTHDNFPLLKQICPRICSEPCRYQRVKVVPLLLAVQARTHTEPPNVTGEGRKYKVQPAYKPRTSRIPCEHSQHFMTDSDTPRLYSQWLNSVIYSATNHWAEAHNAIWRRSDVFLTICWRQSVSTTLNGVTSFFSRQQRKKCM